MPAFLFRRGIPIALMNEGKINLAIFRPAGVAVNSPGLRGIRPQADSLEDSSVVKMSGGRAVVESLRVEDVRHVFGIVGSCMIEILDDMYDRQDIGWIGTRHEQGAAHMADGYARVSGKAGVCMATNGPGATNLTTGLSVALLSHSPLIAITGAPMVSQQYRDSFQEIDQVAMFRPLTKWSVQVPRADRIPELFRHAFRMAMSGKKGPVHIDLPRDLLNEDIEAEDRKSVV